MSAREWKPGDLALAFNDSIEFRVVRHAGGDGPDYWSAANGTYPLCDAARSEYLNYRPLVVLDPEDREQVERLLVTYHDRQVADRDVTDMQAALRDFASPTPPKPDEPMGLGAVVEDEDGVRHVRAFGIAKSAWLGHVEADGGERQRRYEDIAVVRVLSEGVSDA